MPDRPGATNRSTHLISPPTRITAPEQAESDDAPYDSQRPIPGPSSINKGGRVTDGMPDRSFQHHGYSVLVEACEADGFAAWTFDATVMAADGSVCAALVNESIAHFATAVAALDRGECVARGCVDAILGL